MTSVRMGSGRKGREGMRDGRAGESSLELSLSRNVLLRLREGGSQPALRSAMLGLQATVRLRGLQAKTDRDSLKHA